MKRGKKVALVIIAAVLIILAILAGVYFYRNMHPKDDKDWEKTVKAGFTEKQAKLPDGTVINYGEGPNGGPSLLLIHGQGGDWTDYASVLPKLSKEFHVYAVDCYGHGKSSHDTALYSCKKNGEALKWFIENVIGEKCYVSGHSSGGILTAWLAAYAPESVSGIVLEDPPLFEVTSKEMQEGSGCAAWWDSFTIKHNFLNQTAEGDYATYYMENSYFMKFFGGLQSKLVSSVHNYRQKHPGEKVRVFWLPYSLLRGIETDSYDLRFGDTFYTGSWFDGVDQETILLNIKCLTIYLKAKTQYGKDGVVYAANTDEDAHKVLQLIDGCEMLSIKSSHDIHYEHPAFFISACEELLGKG